MSAPIRRQVLPLLLSLTSHPEDTSRSAASGSLGAFCKWLPEDDLNNVVEDTMLTIGSTSGDSDWQVKHGKSAALFVGLKDAPERIFTDSHKTKVITTIKNLLLADRVALAQNGVRSAGYLFVHLVKLGEPLPIDLVTPFCK